MHNDSILRNNDGPSCAAEDGPSAEGCSRRTSGTSDESARASTPTARGRQSDSVALLSILVFQALAGVSIVTALLRASNCRVAEFAPSRPAKVSATVSITTAGGDNFLWNQFRAASPLACDGELGAMHGSMILKSAMYSLQNLAPMLLQGLRRGLDSSDWFLWSGLMIIPFYACVLLLVMAASRWMSQEAHGSLLIKLHAAYM